MRQAGDLTFEILLTARAQLSVPEGIPKAQTFMKLATRVIASIGGVITMQGIPTAHSRMRLCTPELLRLSLPGTLLGARSYRQDSAKSSTELAPLTWRTR